MSIERRELDRRDFIAVSSATALAGSALAMPLRSTASTGLAQSPSGSPASRETVSVLKTPKDSYQIRVKGATIDFNLVPMNSQIAEDCGEKVAYSSVRPDAVVLASPISCLVGIVGLALDGSPRVPRIVWDNREHQFWEGFEGTYEPRNVVVNAPRVEVTADKSAVEVSYYYIANFVKTTITSRFADPPFAEYKCMWDTTITVDNLTGKVLKNYLQFFACYHQAGTNYYWDSSNEIKPCPGGGFNASPDAETIQMVQASPYTVHSNRYKRDHQIVFFQYKKPLLISQRQPWFGGLQHVMLVDPRTCATVTTWEQQARDHTVRPPKGDFQVGESFTSRVRHVITAADTVSDLEKIWGHFEQSL
jgi:hypothetical protein